MRASAIANATAKTITGSMASSTAALTGFGGTRPTSQLVNEGSAGTAPAAELAPRSDAADAASILSSEKSGGAARKVSSATVERITAYSATARPPSRPTARVSFSSAMVAISSETTSGMIVIRIALTHTVPTGSIAATKPAAPRHDDTRDHHAGREAGDEADQGAEGGFGHGTKLRLPDSQRLRMRPPGWMDS